MLKNIHPFMLSKWRQQVRDGVLRARGQPMLVPPALTKEGALRRAIARYVRFYNYRRRRSAPGYRSPVDYW